jgi:hypothetical protein
MDKLKATESVELALEALRGLEEAIQAGHRHTIDLKIEVLRGELFNILEMIKLENEA